MSIASPTMVKYTSLNSSPGINPKFSSQRSAKYVEKGFSAEETSGHVFHNVMKRVASHNKQNIKLRA